MDTFNIEARKLTDSLESEAHKFGSRTAEKVGSAVEQAGVKVDAALDYVSDKTQKAKETIHQVSQEGWDGVKRKTSDYAREEPLIAMLVAIGAGVLVGWLFGRKTTYS